MSSSCCGRQEKRAFDEDGFVAIRGFLRDRELTELSEHVERLLREVVPAMSAEDAFYEDPRDPATLKQLQRIERYDSYFLRLLESDRWRNVAECLLAQPSVPRNVELFCKPPRSGRPTPPHQDGHYFMLDPCEAVTLWLALDRVDEENGCVRYVRGSHRDGLRQHARTRTLGFSQGIVDFPAEHDAAREVAVPADPGDLLVHHALTIHHAGANQSSDRQRRALGIVFFSERARPDAAALAAYQRRLTAELRAAGRI